MKSASLVVVGLLILGAAPRAGAQQQPPPPLQPYLAPSPLEIAALDAGGRHKKRVGLVLMVTGGTIIVAGTGLMIAGAWDRDGRCVNRYRDYYYDDGRCFNTALTVAGATTTLVGIGALVPGIVEHISGANDVAEARRLRLVLTGW